MICEKISGFSDEIASLVTQQFQVLNKLGISYFEPRGIDGKNISELSDKEVAKLKEILGMCCSDRFFGRSAARGNPE